eukprot:gene12759-50777_t
MLKQLTHPNIVRVWDFFVPPSGGAEIVMSFWTQGSVKHQLKEFGALKVVTLRKYAMQILTGIRFLHSCYVLHRDIKPENVLVNACGVVALTDFGLAAHVESEDNYDYVSMLALDERSATGASNPPESESPVAGVRPKTQQPIGTPPFISPRIGFLGLIKGGSPQSDLWAFGCTMLEMATAHLPWSGDRTHWAVGSRRPWTVENYFVAMGMWINAGLCPLDARDPVGELAWDAAAAAATAALDDGTTSFVRACFGAEAARFGDAEAEHVTARALLEH